MVIRGLTRSDEARWPKGSLLQTSRGDRSLCSKDLPEQKEQKSDMSYL